MARAKSIPKSLHGRIVARWLDGQPIKSIVDWIHAGNASRTEPVITSRSSINRLVEKYANADDLSSAPVIVRRARLLAPQALGEFNAAAVQLDTWIDAPDDAPRVSAAQLRQNTLRYQKAIRWLKVGGVHANRRLPDDEEAGRKFLELLQSPEEFAGLFEPNEDKDGAKIVRLDCENSGESSGTMSNTFSLIKPVQPFHYSRKPSARPARAEKGHPVAVRSSPVPAVAAGTNQSEPSEAAHLA